MAIFFFTLPLAALYFGAYQERGPVVVIQAALYFAIAARLWSLAKHRTQPVQDR